MAYQKLITEICEDCGSRNIREFTESDIRFDGFHTTHTHIDECDVCKNLPTEDQIFDEE